jgi:peptidoglycan hydrolase-like protein with peptidoglycan-binding domain
VAIGLGVFGLGVIMNEAARAERDGDYDDYDHDDDDDYRERSHRSESKSRSTRSRSSAPAIQFSQDVLETQKSLNQAGYDAGAEDGLRGGQTTTAVKAFQRDKGYPETGKLTEAQRASLHAMAAEAGKTQIGAADDAANVETASEPSPAATAPEQDSYKPNFGKQAAQDETKTVAGHENTRKTVPEAEIDLHMLEVEKALFSLQMIESEPDGKSDDATIAAIKQFQSFLNETPTGELTTAQRANLISLAEAY